MLLFISSMIDLALLLVDAITELILELLRRLHYTVLINGIFKLTVDFHLSECYLIVRAVSDVENAAFILAPKTSPH